MQTEEKLAPYCSVVQIIPQQAMTGQLIVAEVSMGWRRDGVAQEVLVPGRAVPEGQNGMSPHVTHMPIHAHAPSSWLTSLLTCLVD